jgi:hypothetical protein
MVGVGLLEAVVKSSRHVSHGVCGMCRVEEEIKWERIEEEQKSRVLTATYNNA